MKLQSVNFKSYDKKKKEKEGMELNLQGKIFSYDTREDSKSYQE